MRLISLTWLIGAVAAANSDIKFKTTPPEEIARLAMTDKSPKGFLFRGDSRSPEAVFKEGFSPYRSHYFLDTGNPRFVSLTRRATTAIYYSNGHHATGPGVANGGYVYVLSPEGIRGRAAYWLPDIDRSNAWKFELAVDGSIKPETIVGAYQFEHVHDKPKMKKWIPNSEYKYAAESPFTPRSTSCLARACRGVSHAVAATCQAVQSCFRPRQQVLDADKRLAAHKVLCQRGVEDCIQRPATDTGKKKPSTHGAQEDAVSKSERARVAERAKSVSADEFDKSVAKRLRSVPKAWKDKGVGSFQDVRTRILGYKPLAADSPSLRPGAGMSSMGSIATGAVVTAGVLWVKSIVDAFTTNTTSLDRAAATASIVPFVGCALHTASSIQAQESTDMVVLDAILCNVADALLLGPLAPFGFGLHFVRLLMGFIRAPPTVPTREQVHETRDDSWAESLKDVFAYIYSHEYTYPSQPFASKLESVLDIDAASVRIGALNATGSAEIYPDNSEIDPARLESRSAQAIRKIRAERDTVIARRQRQYLFSIPDEFANGTALSLRKTAKDFNTAFINHIRSKDFLNNYPDQNAVENLYDAMTVVTLDPIDRYSIAREKMNKAAEYLSTRPPPIPQALDVAFVLGQSKGFKFVQPDTLSLYSYFNTEIAEALTQPLLPLHRYYILIRHTLQVIKYIQGKLKQDELDVSFFPVANPGLVKGLQYLIAMRLGKVYEDYKIKTLDDMYQKGQWILSPTAPPYIINPYVPPLPEHPDNGMLLSLVLVLTTTVNDEAFVNETKEYIDKETPYGTGFNLIQQKFQELQKAAAQLAQGKFPGPQMPNEFLEKHRPTCVALGAGEQDCKYIVQGCFGGNTSDEFVQKCLQGSFGPVESMRKQIKVGRSELCDKFGRASKCNGALRKCSKRYPRASVLVLFDCAAGFAPQTVNATNTSQ